MAFPKNSDLTDKELKRLMYERVIPMRGREFLRELVDARRYLRGALPEIPGESFLLLWDHNYKSGECLIRLGESVVARFPAGYECSEQYAAVAFLLYQKYRGRLLDLFPTWESASMLFGDRLGTCNEVMDTRYLLFGYRGEESWVAQNQVSRISKCQN
jgi:hypothetical protein